MTNTPSAQSFNVPISKQGNRENKPPRTTLNKYPSTEKLISK